MTTAINYFTWSMDDIVFDNRNKDYGAYQLRKQSEKNIRTGLFITFSGVIVSLLLSSFNWPSKHADDKPLDVVATVHDPLVINHPDLPIVPPPPPPHRPTIRFVEMLVQRNHEVSQNEPAPVMPDDKRDISTETKDGDITAATTFSEETPSKLGPPEPTQPTIYTWVEQPAEYEGGDEALLKFISDNIHYPQMDIDNDIQGKVYLKFVVMEDGSVSGVQVMRGVESTMDKEAIRVVKMLSKFHPGKQQGKPVKVYFTLPIVFKLNH
jgi:protein TonB